MNFLKYSALVGFVGVVNSVDAQCIQGGDCRAPSFSVNTIGGIHHQLAPGRAGKNPFAGSRTRNFDYTPEQIAYNDSLSRDTRTRDPVTGEIDSVRVAHLEKLDASRDAKATREAAREKESAERLAQVRAGRAAFRAKQNGSDVQAVQEAGSQGAGSDNEHEDNQSGYFVGGPTIRLQ